MRHRNTYAITLAGWLLGDARCKHSNVEVCVVREDSALRPQVRERLANWLEKPVCDGVLAVEDHERRRPVVTDVCVLLQLPVNSDWRIRANDEQLRPRLQHGRRQRGGRKYKSFHRTLSDQCSVTQRRVPSVPHTSFQAREVLHPIVIPHLPVPDVVS